MPRNKQEGLPNDESSETLNQETANQEALGEEEMATISAKAEVAQKEEESNPEKIDELKKEVDEKMEANQGMARSKENDAKFRKLGFSWSEKEGKYTRGYQDFMRSQKEDVKSTEETAAMLSGRKEPNWSDKFQVGVGRIIHDVIYGREKFKDENK